MELLVIPKIINLEGLIFFSFGNLNVDYLL
jgi:hypothetical protein